MNSFGLHTKFNAVVVYSGKHKIGQYDPPLLLEHFNNGAVNKNSERGILLSFIQSERSFRAA